MNSFSGIAACGLAIGIAGLAVAQPPAGDTRPDHAQMEQMRADRQARTADDMVLLLGLRPDQRAAFDHYRQAMHPSYHRDQAGSSGMRDRVGPDASLPARLDAAQARADRHDAMVKERIAATRQFYAGLTPDQQHRFDALERLRHGDGYGHHRWPNGMGDHRMGSGI